MKNPNLQRLHADADQIVWRLLTTAVGEKSIAKEYGVSSCAVRRLLTARTTREQREANRLRKRPPWTPEALATLRQLAGTMIAAQIATRMNRTTTSIHAAMKKFGLSDPLRRHPALGESFDAYVRTQHALGWTDTEIAAGWSQDKDRMTDRHCVSKRRQRMGLCCNAHHERQRDRVRQTTALQLKAAGFESLGQLRAVELAERATRYGWPGGLRWRAVEILNLLWDHGPMTRQEIAERLGMRNGSRKEFNKSFSSNERSDGDPTRGGGSYFANLIRRGLVLKMRKANKIPKDKNAPRTRGGARNTDIYTLSLWVQRGKVLHERQHNKRKRNRKTGRQASCDHASGGDAALDREDARGGDGSDHGTGREGDRRRPDRAGQEGGQERDPVCV